MQRTRTTYLTWSSIRVCVCIRFKSRTRSPTLTIVSEDMRTHTQTHVYTYIFILETCLRRNLFYILFHDAHAANVYTKRCHLATTHTPIVTTATSQDRRRRRPFFFRPVLSAPPSPPHTQSSCFTYGVTIRFATQLRQHICLRKMHVYIQIDTRDHLRSEIRNVYMYTYITTYENGHEFTRNRVFLFLPNVALVRTDFRLTMLWNFGACYRKCHVNSGSHKHLHRI